jgi:hypothetical protein
MLELSWLARSSRLGLVVLLALGFAACGGDGSDGPSHGTVRQAIAELQRAFAERDYDALCELVTPAAARQAGEAAHGTPRDCPADLRRLFGMIHKGGGWREGSAPRVTGVAVDGSQATATVALGSGSPIRARVPLTRSEGAWRLTGFFGNPPQKVEEFVKSVKGSDFPSAGREPLEVLDRRGKPCPELIHFGYPQVSGGCSLEFSSGVHPLTILTPFGAFEFEDCYVSYGVRVDSSGRTWTEELLVEDGPGSVACADVTPCPHRSIGALRPPWRGRLYRDGDGRLLHRMDMCMLTCIGVFVGELQMRLVRDGDRWRAEPANGGGESGLLFDHPLRVEGGFEIGPAPRRAGT